MAAEYRREKEHAFVTMEKDLKTGKIPRLVLLCGKEEYLIRFYTDTLVNRYVSQACRAIDLVSLAGEMLTIDKIKESLETVSLMSERKLVLLEDFPPANRKRLKGFSDNDVKELIEYMEDIPQGSMLLITAAEDEEQQKKSKLRAAVEKRGKVYDFQPLKDKQLKSFIEKRLRGSQLSYMPGVVNMIIENSGYGNKSIEYGLYNLENDLRKIIAHSSGGEITAADVSSVLSTNPENNVFAMIDAIGRNRKDEALKLLHNLLEAGTSEFNLLRMITGQLELMLSVREMREDGLSLTEMQKKLNIHQFRVKKAAGAVGRYSVSELKRMLSHAYDVDENIKTGLMDGQLALEFFIAQI